MVIPLFKSYVDDEIREAILRVANSGWYILAEECKKFEREFADYIGTKHAILTSSGTSAIFLCLNALDIKVDDEVLVPSLTAFPTIEGIISNGAKPVFVDIDNRYGMDLGRIRKGKNVKAILPVHLYGSPVDMEDVLEFAAEYGIHIVEDCCQAHGATYDGKKVGSIGIAGCFSFYPSKNMTVYGDGGIITTSDDKLAEICRMLRDHGRKTKYNNEICGFNMRFNEIQAAVGRIQLRKLDSFNESRRQIASWYRDKLEGLPIFIASERPKTKCVYHMFIIAVEDRDALSSYLKANGIETGLHYPVPCHLQPAIKNMGINFVLPKTEGAVGRILSLPMYPDLSIDEVDYICGTIKEFYAKG